MLNIGCAFKVSFTKRLVLEIAFFYVRKCLFAKTIRYGIVICFFACASIREMVVAKGSDLNHMALVSAIVASVIASVMLLEYRYILLRLERAYGVSPHYGIEYQFLDDKVVSALDQKRLEVPWTDIKQVWISRRLLMFVTYRRQIVALPILKLNADQKSYLIQKLESMHLLNSWQLSLIS